MAAAKAGGISSSYAAKLAEPAVRKYLERYIAFCYADDMITADEISLFDKVVRAFNVDDKVAGEYRERLSQGLRIAHVRMGQLPKFRPSNIYLDSDEICHLDVPATYERILKTSVDFVGGRMLVTNKRFRFISPDKGWELSWNKIVRIQYTQNSMDLFATQHKGSGSYLVSDPEYCSTVADMTARTAKREVLPSLRGRDTRRIPQAMKAEVWSRDGGECQECGSNTYLEFDHVIPLAKGGATSVRNLQLLCHGCNLRKRDRI
jgi:hypothetical protein